MAERQRSRVHGVVLAGAYPTGGTLLDDLAPRPLLPVAQRPLIAYSLRWMKTGGVPSVTVCANSAARAVRSEIAGTDADMPVDYLEDWTPRGAAGCVRDAGVRTDADTFVIADGTAVPVIDLNALLAAHRASEAAATIVAGADGGGRLRPTGFYVFERRAFQFIPEEGYYDIKEKLIPRLHKAGEHVSTYMATEVAPRPVNADGYLALNHWVIERASAHLSSTAGFLTIGESFVHKTAIVDPTARLLGPVLVGPRVSIGADVTLVGPVSVGPGTTVEGGAVVSRSVVWSGCSVGADAFVDRSMLADGARVASHSLVVSAGKADERRAPTHGRALLRAGNALLAPLASVLRPGLSAER
jgi:NDP-sugar pyrophosphorylase family protein